MNNITYDDFRHLGETRKSGEVCPISGYWRSDHHPSEIIEMKKGDRFPRLGAQSTGWRLVKPRALD